MKRKKQNRRLVGTMALHGAALTMMLLAGDLLSLHARAVHDVTSLSLPVLAELPVMERKLDALTQQVEMAELHSATRLGSEEERINVYVLPEKADFDRLLAIFDLVNEYLGSAGVMQDMSDIEIGEEQPDGALKSRPIHLTFAANERGVREFMSLIRLSGFLTVGDALTDEERAILIERTEAENPTGVVSLEQFLSTDLLRYALDSRSYEEQLLRSFSSPSFTNAFNSVLQTSILRDARMALGNDLGHVVEEYDLWPFPFLSVDAVRLTKGGAAGWYTVSIQLLVYTR